MQFLHGMCPSWRSLFAHSSFSDCVLHRPVSPQTMYHCPLMFHGVFVHHSSAVSCINTQPVAFCCYAVGWSAGYQNVKHLLAVSVKAHHCMVNIWVIHHAVSCWILVCLIAVGAVKVLDVLWICLATSGTPISVKGFLSSSQAELEHWTHGIKDTEMLDIVNAVDIYWFIPHSEDLNIDQQMNKDISI